MATRKPRGSKFRSLTASQALQYVFEDDEQHDSSEDSYKPSSENSTGMYIRKIKIFAYPQW